MHDEWLIEDIADGDPGNVILVDATVDLSEFYASTAQKKDSMTFAVEIFYHGIEWLQLHSASDFSALSYSHSSVDVTTIIDLVLRLAERCCRFMDNKKVDQKLLQRTVRRWFRSRMLKTPTSVFYLVEDTPVVENGDPDPTPRVRFDIKRVASELREFIFTTYTTKPDTFTAESVEPWALRWHTSIELALQKLQAVAARECVTTLSMLSCTPDPSNEYYDDGSIDTSAEPIKGRRHPRHGVYHQRVVSATAKTASKHGDQENDANMMFPMDEMI
jgi:hypothetical protein